MNKLVGFASDLAPRYNGCVVGDVLWVMKFDALRNAVLSPKERFAMASDRLCSLMNCAKTTPDVAILSSCFLLSELPISSLLSTGYALPLNEEACERNEAVTS